MKVTLNEPYDIIWYGPYDMVSPNAHWAMSHGPSTCENLELEVKLRVLLLHFECFHFLEKNYSFQ